MLFNMKLLATLMDDHLGALGSWGAAMIEPYSDNPSMKGTLLQSEATLSNLISHFFKDGWQVVSHLLFAHHNEIDTIKNTHCIGDYANHVILDILEQQLQTYNVNETRPRIEHAQIIAEADIPRLGQLGGQSVQFPQEEL
jgi:predicted amidohydrolase YtcJ